MLSLNASADFDPSFSDAANLVSSTFSRITIFSIFKYSGIPEYAKSIYNISFSGNVVTSIISFSMLVIRPFNTFGIGSPK